MSRIIEATLLCVNPEPEVVAEINRQLTVADEARTQRFEAIDMTGAGGSKRYVGGVYAAAFNFVMPAVLPPSDPLVARNGATS